MITFETRHLPGRIEGR